jgi:hypothetical protein
MQDLNAMTARIPAALLAALCALLGACSIMEPRPVTPIADVVATCKSSQPQAGLDAALRTKTTYALRGSDFGKLAAAGCPAPVLDTLQQKFYDDTDLLTRYWVLGESLGGCDRCYPQPVDLSTLGNGGNGMADASKISRISDFSKPAGLPAWVTAYPGPARGPVITADAVAGLARQGKSADEVVAEIERSRAHDFIEDRGITTVETHFKAGLHGSKLAALREDGVPDAVLDALQRKYLAEFIEFNRVRYQNWGKGPNPQ